ncbi:MAG: AraC family transcriptional regulator [Novosphingobium sp.]
MNAITPAKIGQLAIDRGYFAPENMHFEQSDLIGAGAVSATLLRNLPPAASEYPALPFHVVTVPLDVEVYKDCEWSSMRFCGQMRRGDISVIPAGSPSRIEYQGVYRESLNLYILPAYLDQIFLEHFQDLPDASLFPGMIRNNWLTELADRIRNEIAEGGPGGSLLVESLTVAFVVTLARLMSGSRDRQVEIRKSDRIAHPHVKRAIEFIHAHLCEDINLPALAAAAGCNVERLKHSFKDHVGEPPYRYLLRMRIEKARSLLSTSVHDISKVAFMCGFNDQAHFTTAFARIVGTTPAKWRNETKK